MFKSNRFISLLILMFLSFSRPLISMECPVNSRESSIQEDCSICLEDCDSGNDFITPCCRQVFHFECLNGWVTEKKNCPMCRRALSTAGLRQENERQIAARKERERLAREEERQIQEAIRISIEQEEERQIQEAIKRQEQEELKKQTCLASQSREIQITRLMKEQEEIIKNLNLSKAKAIEKLNHLRIEQKRIEKNTTTANKEAPPALTALEQIYHRQRAKRMLYMAILNNSAEEIIQTIEYGVNINHQIPDHGTPIELAVKLARPVAVKTLLECGAQANIHCSGPSLFRNCYISKKGLTYPPFKLIHLSILMGDIKSALALIKHGANFSGDVNTSTQRDILEYVLDYVDEVPEVCLEFIQELINHGYNIHQSEYRKMVHGSHGVFQRQNIWVSIFERHPSLFSTKAILDLFIKNGAKPNQLITGSSGFKTCTPLVLALRYDNMRAVEFLLEAGVDVNQECCIDMRSRRIRPRSRPISYTPLSYMINTKKTMPSVLVNIPHINEMIELLINYGAHHVLQNNENENNQPKAIIKSLKSSMLFDHCVSVCLSQKPCIPGGAILRYFSVIFDQRIDHSLGDKFLRFIRRCRSRYITKHVYLTIKRQQIMNPSLGHNYIFYFKTTMSRKKLQIFLDNVNRDFR